MNCITNAPKKPTSNFFNFKEGWKTDPGMMYILFGPPWYVDRRLDQMQWSYSYNRSDPGTEFFVFTAQVKIGVLFFLSTIYYNAINSTTTWNISNVRFGLQELFCSADYNPIYIEGM
jgi:hypothetical protein